MRSISLVRGFDVFNFCRPVFQIAARLEIGSGLEAESRKLKLVIVVGMERERLCARRDAQVEVWCVTVHTRQQSHDETMRPAGDELFSTNQMRRLAPGRTILFQPSLPLVTRLPVFLRRRIRLGIVRKLSTVWVSCGVLANFAAARSTS